MPASIPEPKLPASYGRLSKVYSLLEYCAFGPKLQSARKAWWRDLDGLDHVLIIGDGDGRFSTFLLSNLPDLKITSIDSSLEMLEIAKKRRMKCGLNDDRITSVHCDIRTWKPRSSAMYDAVVAQFVFDSFTEFEIEQIGVKLQETLCESGFITVSEFHIPNDTWIGKIRAKLTLGCLYPAFKLLTGLQINKLPDYPKVLCRLGFTETKSRYFSNKTLVSQIFQKLEG